jgi:hypothetical protein
VLRDAGPTSAGIIGELLKNHAEATSLLAEASHCQALAASSAADSGKKFRAVQVARLGYEELRHRLDPRRGRPVHFDLGLLLLAVLGVGLVMLDLIELSGLLAGAESVLLALGATAVWMTTAWLAAIAGRRRHRGLVAVIIGVASTLGLLLVALHGVAPNPGWPTARGRVVFAALGCAFILVLAVGAATLIARMEPASLLVARRRWHRARSDYDETDRTRQADLEAAVIASEAWLELVRVRVIKISDGDERLVKEATALAAGLLEAGRPQLGPAG